MCKINQVYVFCLFPQDSFKCPGAYRCHGNHFCIEQSQVCDGQAHCPDEDDELLCGKMF